MAEKIDELTPIANFMVREFTHNPSTPPARLIHENLTIVEACDKQKVQSSWWRTWVQMQTDCADLGVTGFFIACKIWYNQVKTNGPWDHKPIIKRRKDLWSSTGNREWHIYGDTAYNFDCWSNMHYGYVGSAVGFDASTLLDGAGAAQAMSDWKTPGKWPRGTGPNILPRRWDPPEDRITISLGIKLWAQQPDHISAQTLVKAVISTDGLLTKPANELRSGAR